MTDYRPASILGLDPGPRPGVMVLQLEAGAVSGFTVVHAQPEDLPDLMVPELVDHVALERFMVSRGTARRTRGGSDVALAQSVTWSALARERGFPLQYLPAGAVKPWATDTKLKALGLYSVTSGTGGHTRDAARHAVYMAAHRGFLDLGMFGS